MKAESRNGKQISPDHLLDRMGTTPADNPDGFDTAIMWRSEKAADLIRLIFAVQKQLEEIGNLPLLFGPWPQLSFLQCHAIKHRLISLVARGCHPETNAAEVDH